MDMRPYPRGNGTEEEERDRREMVRKELRIKH
jgi:hypothetical protein